MTGGERHLPAMNCFSVEVMDIAFHVPPIKWKGDILGHIGINDVFFYVLSGECYMKIEDDCFIVKSGQIAYLPKEKLRAYTRVTEDFVMYEIAFSVKADGKELFSSIGLDEGDYAVDAEDGEMLKNLFEGASRYEFNRSGFFDIAASAKCFEIIAEYIRLRLKSEGKRKPFAEVLNFMKKHLGDNITLSELSDVAFMQKNYFVKKFREVYNMPPMEYFAHLKTYEAMKYLSGGEMRIDETAKMVGISDSAYFSRFFKKHTGLTPAEYRKLFK